MALDQSALNDLLDALRSGGDLDFMREAMQLVLQALIDLEATEKIGASRYEHTDDRTTHRTSTPLTHALRPRARSARMELSTHSRHGTQWRRPQASRRRCPRSP